MTRALARDLAALLLVAIGLGANVAAGGLDPRTLALAVATVLAWGTSGAWGPGLLACLVGGAAHPFDLEPLLPTMTNVTAAVVGAGLGLLVRYLAVHRWQGPLARDTIRAFVALGLGATFVISPSLARLAGPDGTPLLLAMDVVSPAELVSVHVARHVPLSIPHPLAPVAPFLAVLAFGAAWLGFARLGSPSMRDRVMTVIGVLAFVSVVAAMVIPLFDTFALDPELVRAELSLRAGSRGAVLAVAPTEASTALWSRPALDAVRVVLAAALISLTLDRTPHRARPEGDLRFLLLATVCLAVAFGLGAFMPEAVAAAGILTLTAILTARSGREEPARALRGSMSAAPHVAALIALFLLLVSVALAPVLP